VNPSAMDQTVNNEENFLRFAQRLLGDVVAEDPQVAQLKEGLAVYNAWLASQAGRRHSPYPAGPGRLDAYGNQGHNYPAHGLTEIEKMALIEFMKTL
jgi:hypothetical protein